MEATHNTLVEEEILNSARLKIDSKITNSQMLFSPKSAKKINNTDIVIWINDLHKALDNEHEAGIQIDHSGKKITFHIENIAHKNNSLIYFKGHTENGKLVHFVKPLLNLSIQLTTLKRKSSNAQKTPFGFADWEAYENEKYRNRLD